MKYDHQTWAETWADGGDGPDYTGHCEGNQWRKCGRFVGPRAYHCPRCLAEMQAAARKELAQESAEADRRLAAEQAAWAEYESSPEYQAEMARVAALVADDEDLPF